MKERRWGRIVNLSSLAAMLRPGEGLLYTGIKSYVLDMSQSLDMELKPHGIHVTALCPGFTHSEFHDVMGTREAADQLPGFCGSSPRTSCARDGRRYEGQARLHTGTVNKLTAAAIRPVPQRIQYSWAAPSTPSNSRGPSQARKRLSYRFPVHQLPARVHPRRGEHCAHRRTRVRTVGSVPPVPPLSALPQLGLRVLGFPS